MKLNPSLEVCQKSAKFTSCCLKRRLSVCEEELVDACLQVFTSDALFQNIACAIITHTEMTSHAIDHAGDCLAKIYEIPERSQMFETYLAIIDMSKLYAQSVGNGLCVCQAIVL